LGKAPSGPTSTPIEDDASGDLFAGGGELGARMRAMDWAATPLGPVKNWPQSLKTCVRIVLTSRQPMFVWWGDQLINLYNDAYKSILGGKHPEAFAQPAQQVWREIWDQVGPRAASAMRTNEGTYDESLLLLMERNGYREETYYTFSYSPVPNDQGGTGGILCANTDDTERIISQRQNSLVSELALTTSDARNWREACALAAESLAGKPDIRFALVYISSESDDELQLACSVNVSPADTAVPARIRRDENAGWAARGARRTNELQILSSRDYEFPKPVQEDLDGPAKHAAIVPIARAGSSAHTGMMIVGLNPLRQPDASYRDFLSMIAGQIAASIVNAEAYEQERRRAEALAELDRAKTIFFSNVSHEFRTPLTLMLSPLEDLLGRKSELPAELKDIETIHRNGVRLLKLVNTLLDFSRIEAGRINAGYHRFNLGHYTAELASVFQSAMDKAGLRYVIETDCAEEATYVDPEMWEKIVLNLISNAFKFTLAGEVSVRLMYRDGRAELIVGDTGTGIPEEELPRVFDRFHRVEGAVGRTHEGTGIGLALVAELVRMHGGTVQLETRVGAGSTFTVSIPLGSAHLPPERIAASLTRKSGGEGAISFLQEAMRWLPSTEEETEAFNRELPAESASPVTESGEPAAGARPRIVLADDNRDMREYLHRLLAREFTVTVASDGEEALQAALANPPDLVLTDVMMPRMDGFGLIRALRANRQTASIPIVMLSARVGEEAEVEGLEAGADDYLIKPFSAVELIARVNAHVKMHRLRQEMSQKEQELRRAAEAAEHQYKSILESISEAFIFVDREWRISYANSQAAAVFSMDLETKMGRNLWEAFPDLAGSQLGDALRSAMKQGRTVRVEDNYAPVGRWLHVNAYPAPDGISIFVMDVTDRKTQEKQLLISEKLAATGRLAATIAHEINNPLEAVFNLIYLARTTRSDVEKIRAYLATAEREITRVSHIARHTLGFYRDSSQRETIDLPTLIGEVSEIYESRFRSSGVELIRNYQPISEIRGLRGELNQIFSNLLSNAIDAMPSGGKIEIGLEQKNDKIVITLADSGVGIPAENLPKATDPFFTTKKDTGTGLGLWIVNQFVYNWGGTMKITSSTEAQSHGTKITISLPRENVAEFEGTQRPESGTT
jgi:PAS domain S-box-containing protein